MGLKSITLQLPEDVYTAVQEAAQVSHRSVEDVLRDSIDIFFGDVKSTNVENLLSQMSTYTDAQLWAVVYRQLTESQSLRLKKLSAKNKRGKLMEDEQIELDQLLDLMDRYTLLRAQALLLLKQRGQDIDTFVMMRS